MSFIISDFRGIREVDNLKTIRKELLIDCAEWVYSDNFEGEEKNPARLFDICMEQNDFGDIAQVYAFSNCYGLVLEPNESVTLTRIL